MILTGAESALVPPNFDYDWFELPENVALIFRLQPHGSSGDLPSETVLRSELLQQDAVIIETVNPLAEVLKGDAKEYQRIRQTDGEFASWLGRMASALYASRVCSCKSTAI